MPTTVASRRGERLRAVLAAPWRALRDWNAALGAIECPPGGKRRAIIDLGVLAALGASLLGLVLWSAHWRVLSDHPRSHLITWLAELAVYGLACGWVVLRRPPARGALLVIVLVAMAARIAFAPQLPIASDDVYRYVWDGRIQAHGINPYRYPPSDDALASYRDPAIYEHINRRGVRTIYPPVAQAIFLASYAIHPDSLTWTKLMLVGFDLVTMLVLASVLLRLGMRPERMIFYAWHPLLILELGHSGHIDVAAITFLALALRARLARRPVLAGVLLACATLTKFYAIVALPALLWPGGWRAWRRDLQFGAALIVTAALAYVPFLGVGKNIFGYLGGYVQEEGIASGERFYLLRQVRNLAAAWSLTPPRWLAAIPLTAAQYYQGLVLGTMGLLALWCWLKPLVAEREIARRALLLFLALLILTTPTYPWYALLPLAFAPFAGRRLLIPTSILLGTAGLLYLQWWWPGRPTLPLHLDYAGSFLGLVAIAAWTAVRGLRGRRHRPGPPPAQESSLAPANTNSGTAGNADAAPGSAGEEPPSLFDRFPWFYAFCREHLFRDHTERIAAALWPDGPPEHGSTLIELGCGPGYYARRLARRYATLRVTGIDRSAEQLRRARARAGDLDNCRFQQGDVRALAQSAGTADAILTSRLFTILPEREQALAEMHRVLRTGGRCFIAEPRSGLWTAIPLRALWLLANVTRRWGSDRATYREPACAITLCQEQFGAFLRSQPWAEVGEWRDRRYHYAICRKAEHPRDAFAAD